VDGRLNRTIPRTKRREQGYFSQIINVVDKKGGVLTMKSKVTCGSSFAQSKGGAKNPGSPPCGPGKSQG